MSALLYGAMRLPAFYDDFWTMPTQPGSIYVGQAENHTELSALISILSGPVGFSDLIGNTNVSLLAVTMDGNGMLLSPSVPMYPVDGYFTGAVPGAGVMFQAPTYMPLSAAAAAAPNAGSLDAPTPFPWTTLLAADVPATFNITPATLFPQVGVSQAVVGNISARTYAAVPWSPGFAAVAAACATGQSAATCAVPFDGAHGLTVNTGGERADEFKPHELWSLAPLFSNGYALIGELGKAVRVSVRRFQYVNATWTPQGQPSLTFELHGASGEQVAVTVLENAALAGAQLSGDACTFPFTLPASGAVRVTAVTGGAGAGPVAGAGTGTGACVQPTVVEL